MLADEDRQLRDGMHMDEAAPWLNSSEDVHLYADLILHYLYDHANALAVVLSRFFPPDDPRPSEVLIWGGSFGPSNPTQGAAYDPAADSWRSLAPSPLYGRNDATAVWTGDRLVVTDGTASYASPDSGAGSAIYDPRSDVWKVISDPPGGLACNSSGVGTPLGLYLLGGSVGCTAVTTPREAVLHLERPR